MRRELSVLWLWRTFQRVTPFFALLLLPVPAALSQSGSPHFVESVPQNETPGSEPHRRAQLFDALKGARSESEARRIETDIRYLFLAAASDEDARTLVDEAMRKREVYDFAGARQLLDRAIAHAPHYAEAYNQRGFVRFLQEDFDGALEDVDKALELEPKHFAAMSGRALILMRLGRFQLAQSQLRQAVAIHPFLKERSMIVPGWGGRPERPKENGLDL